MFIFCDICHFLVDLYDFPTALKEWGKGTEVKGGGKRRDEEKEEKLPSVTWVGG